MEIKRIGIIMNGVTGRMGTNQHLARSIAAIIKEGGIKVGNDLIIMPDPILTGRRDYALKELAEKYGNDAKGEPFKYIWAKFNKQSMIAFLERIGFQKNTFLETVEGSCLDAALILGLPPMKSGQWSRSILEVSRARKLATGKGVTVAILDRMFDKESPVLKNRVVKPGSVIDGVPVFSSLGHGTWMAA